MALSREKLVCRFCVASNIEKNQGRSDGRRSFVIPGSAPHYAPDIPFRLEHILLDVAVDPQGRALTGTATQRLRAVMPGQTRIRMDQIGLAIEGVEIGGTSASFSTEGPALWIEIPGAQANPAPGTEITVKIRYSLKNPRRGIYFTGPDENHPNRRYQVWTQGQDEDSRYWFPTFDYPNQKATSEVIATVPKGFTAVSNGALVSRQDVPEGVRFHYRLGTPHVTYLVTLAVAEFSSWEDSGPRGLPVQYFVEPGREEDGKRAFSNTPKMIEAFEKKIGVSYPYEKYSQVAVQDFIFGGMENTSATTQTDLTLHDARAHLDFTSDSLVSHELAHQWFGDLLTLRDWSQGWLNEGFATFMERVWVENNQAPDGGPDEAKYYAYQDLKEYLHDDQQRYRRPIVCNTYIEPIDLFDTHLYQKGGLVLNLIRATLGEDAFWKSIQLYVTRHRGQNVETLDLIRAIEDATGRNLRRLFDEWVFSAGYPEFELSYQWHEDTKLAEIVIEQKQTGGKPFSTEGDFKTPLFHLPARIELTFENGSKIERRIETGEARDRVFLPAASKPLMVRFDPDFTIPKTLKFPRPKEMLLYQLQNDSDCMGRIEAAQELGKIVDSQVIVALGKALLADRFWGVQAEIASVLEGVRRDDAKEALIQGLKVTHPKARRAVVRALGAYGDEAVTRGLKPLATRDESYYVEADAAGSWASAFTKLSPGDGKKIDEIESFLLGKLALPSYREVIRGAALSGLAKLPGINRGERPRATQALLEWSAGDKPMDARAAAIINLGRVAKTATPVERARIFEAFGRIADEDAFRTRMALVVALEESEAPEAIGLLSRIRALDLDGRVRRHAQDGADRLVTASTTPESVSNLKSGLEKLEEEHRKLKAELEELKARAAKPAGT